ncbi:MFS general substrate transporter [Punctularia strigosozonata HHB-11173 SS5]|uniref:MFS general substrate transporter n=1 Tax=Punctularia strigosozonata (strain HHB-11173) TaxID=741275 RepID=UPI0004416501|nr:MFS general substrate transporter [Punctularia strigosozonata HHB-11173 SS5]EIN05822.1 MFS general substrate transporter [Punctularia strigosozonata HHB-11173 SS5]
MHLARTSSDETLGGNDLERVPPDLESAGGQDDHHLNDGETPLLGPSPTPLPKRSLAALCAIRLVDPIAFTVIFPFINEMIESLQLTQDTSKIVFYSGMVESAYAIAELCSIYQWAALSDRVGRRPVLFIGTLGAGLATVLFSLSRSLSGLLLARCLGGICSGITAVIQSVLGEMTDSSNQATAFPIFHLFWPLGVIIGPLIGGSLSNMASNAGRSPFLKSYVPFLLTYPYFLPCLAAGAISLLAVCLGWYWLEETLPSKRRPAPSALRKVKLNPGRAYGAVAPPSPPPASSAPHGFPGGPEDRAAKPPSAWSLLGIPALRALCLSGAALSFAATAFDVVFVLFCYTPLQSGGLGFNASKIGYALSFAGAGSIALQLLAMPVLLRRCDNARLYRTCLAVWPLTFVGLPVLRRVVGGAEERDAHAGALLWLGLGLVLLLSRVGCLAYSVNMVLVKAHAAPSALGRANGLAQVAQCLARAGAPAFASAVYAASVGAGPGPGLWVGVMSGLAALGWASSRGVRG